MIIIKGVHPIPDLFKLVIVWLFKNMPDIITELKLPECVYDQVNQILMYYNQNHNLNNEQYFVNKLIETDDFFVVYYEPCYIFNYLNRPANLFNGDYILHRGTVCNIVRINMTMKIEYNVGNELSRYGSTIIIHLGSGDYFFPCDSSRDYVKDFVQIFWKTEKRDIEFRVMDDIDYIEVVNGLQKFATKINHRSKLYKLIEYYRANVGFMKNNKIFGNLVQYVEYYNEIIKRVDHKVNKKYNYYIAEDIDLKILEQEILNNSPTSCVSSIIDKLIYNLGVSKTGWWLKSLSLDDIRCMFYYKDIDPI